MRIVYLLTFLYALTGLQADDGFVKKLKSEFEKNLTVKRLANGLTIMMYEKHDAPVVYIQSGFKVGSADEHSGNFGGTHMLEHMLFKGSKVYGTKDIQKELQLERQVVKWAEKIDLENRKEKPLAVKLKFYKQRLKAVQERQQKFIVKNPYSPIYSANGGTGFNAYTSNDNTVYIINLPSNKLELWATLEAQRITNPVFRSYYQERDVVVEERRMRTESSPRGKMWEAFMSTAFRAHAYRNPVIGWQSEIEVLNKNGLDDFFNTYYKPNNCVMVLVGDVYPDKVIPMMEKYFGAWEPAKLIPRNNVIEPEQKGERIVKVHHKAQPFFYTGYHMPRMNTREGTALDLFADLLAKGRSSLFYKDIVVKRKLASAVFAASGVGGSRYPGLLLMGGFPKAPHTNQDVMKAVDENIAKLIKDGVDDKALNRLISGYKAQFIYALESSNTIASILIRHQLNYDSWEEAFDGFERTLSITKDEIIAAAKKYVHSQNRTVGEMVTEKKGS